MAFLGRRFLFHDESSWNMLLIESISIALWAIAISFKHVHNYCTMAPNFYRYKTFVIFKSVTFDFFLKIMESVRDDANSIFHEDQKVFKSDTIFVTFKSVTFEIFRKCSESVNFDANNDLQEDLKIFKSDTFENYKSFVPSDVHSLTLCSSTLLVFVLIVVTMKKKT